MVFTGVLSNASVNKMCASMRPVPLGRSDLLLTRDINTSGVYSRPTDFVKPLARPKNAMAMINNKAPNKVSETINLQQKYTQAVASAPVPIRISRVVAHALGRLPIEARNAIYCNLKVGVSPADLGINDFSGMPVLERDDMIVAVNEEQEAVEIGVRPFDMGKWEKFFRDKYGREGDVYLSEEDLIRRRGDDDLTGIDDDNNDPNYMGSDDGDLGGLDENDNPLLPDMRPTDVIQDLNDIDEFDYLPQPEDIREMAERIASEITAEGVDVFTAREDALNMATQAVNDMIYEASQQASDERGDFQGRPASPVGGNEGMVGDWGKWEYLPPPKDPIGEKIPETDFSEQNLEQNLEQRLEYADDITAYHRGDEDYDEQDMIKQTEHATGLFNPSVGRIKPSRFRGAQTTGGIRLPRPTQETRVKRGKGGYSSYSGRAPISLVAGQTPEPLDVDEL